MIIFKIFFIALISKNFKPFVFSHTLILIVHSTIKIATSIYHFLETYKIFWGLKFILQ